MNATAASPARQMNMPVTLDSSKHMSVSLSVRDITHFLKEIPVFAEQQFCFNIDVDVYVEAPKCQTSTIKVSSIQNESY